MPVHGMKSAARAGAAGALSPQRLVGARLRKHTPGPVALLATAALAIIMAWMVSGTAAAQISFDPATYKAMAPASSSETIPVGTRITKDNWTQYRKFLPAGVQALFSGRYLFHMGSDPGFAIEVGATIHIPLPNKVVSDTEKYSGQVRLKDISGGGKAPAGYVAGIPFPNPADPDLAYKIIYDNWYRWYPFVQTFHSHTNLVDRFQNLFYQLSQTTYWRLSHLSDRDYPINMPYAAGYSLNSRFFILAPEQSKYTTELEMLHDDPTVVPELYVYLPSLRRSLRLSSAARCAPLLGTDYTGDDGAGVSVTSPGLFRIELLGEYKILGLLHEDPVAREKNETFLIKSTVPGWPTPKDGKWELRDTYVVALYPLPELGTNYCYGVRIVYIDKETWDNYYFDLYDSGRKLWKTEWLFTYPMDIGGGEKAITNNNTSTMLDLQNSHATAVVETNYALDKNAPADLQDAATWAFPGSLGQIMR
jgi:hypothetical protein